jgi:hypothetical protein
MKIPLPKFIYPLLSEFLLESAAIIKTIAINATSTPTTMRIQAGRLGEKGVKEEVDGNGNGVLSGSIAWFVDSDVTSPRPRPVRVSATTI